MKMKKAVPVVMVAILALGSLSGCKPHDVPAKSTGSSLNSVDLAAGVAPEALIQAFQQNGFDTIDGKTFEQIVPSDTPSRPYIGVVALRDTTVKGPNEFVVGVGSDAVFWYESHNVSGDAIADWGAHVKKRIDLVEKLAANKKLSGEPKRQNKRMNASRNRPGWLASLGNVNSRPRYPKRTIT